MLPPYLGDKRGAQEEETKSHLDIERGGRPSVDVNASLNGSTSLSEPLLNDPNDPSNEPPMSTMRALHKQDSGTGLSWSPFSENDPIRWSLHEECVSSTPSTLHRTCTAHTAQHSATQRNTAQHRATQRNTA